MDDRLRERIHENCKLRRRNRSIVSKYEDIQLSTVNFYAS